MGLRGVGWLIRHLFWADITHCPLFSYDLRARPTTRLIMWFSVCLFATAAVFPSVANGSPASILSSLPEPWSGSLNSPWQKPSLNADDSRRFERRESTNAFDHNPNGSEFLWVLQDTYQGKTFYECVAVCWANEIGYLTSPTVDGTSSQEMIQPSKLCVVFDGDDIC